MDITEVRFVCSTPQWLDTLGWRQERVRLINLSHNCSSIRCTVTICAQILDNRTSLQLCCFRVSTCVRACTRVCARRVSLQTGLTRTHLPAVKGGPVSCDAILYFIFDLGRAGKEPLEDCIYFFSFVGWFPRWRLFSSSLSSRWEPQLRAVSRRSSSTFFAKHHLI